MVLPPLCQMRKMERNERTGSTATVADMALSACCRRKALLEHFGERRGRCNAAEEEPCDFCQSPKHVVRRTLVLLDENVPLGKGLHVQLPERLKALDACNIGRQRQWLG